MYHLNIVTFPQVLSWNEFKSICKLFDEVEWFDMAEVTGADFTSSMQVSVSHCHVTYFIVISL